MDIIQHSPIRNRCTDRVYVGKEQTMTNEQAIKIIQNEYRCVDCDCDIERSCGKCELHMPSKEPILKAYKMAIKALSQDTQKSGKWIALVARPMTNEEREYYSEQLDYCDGDAVIYDCPLPEEGQDVLITTCTGVVLIDTFFNDYDGCGFEGYDIEDVKAWMPLPEPYEPQESEDK